MVIIRGGNGEGPGGVWGRSPNCLGKVSKLFGEGPIIIP